MRESVIYQEIQAEAKAIGENIGEARGEEKKALEIARNLLNLGISTEQIIQATGLSAEQLQQLQSSD